MFLPYVTVLVCTLGRSSVLDETINSLLNQTYPSDCYEIIVVVDENKEALKKLEKYPVKVIFRPERKGLSSARNLCLKSAKGEIVIFIDDDCIADRNWIKETVKAFNNEEVKGVGGIVRPLCDDPVSKSITLLELVGVAYVEREEEAGLNHLRIAGINSAYRKNIIEEMGGWDEKISYGGDDVDFNYRLFKKNYKLKITPKAVVYHKHRSSLKEIFWWSYRLGIGYAYVIRKHRFYLRALLISIPFLLIIFFFVIEFLLFTHWGIFVNLISLFLFAFAYCSWTFYKGKTTNVKLDWKTLLYIPFVILSFSVGGILGRLKGFTKK